MALHNAAISEGTRKNRYKQASVYIRFTLQHNMDYLSPAIYDIGLYVAHLANIMSPASLRNYVSGAKTWVTAQCGDPSAFSSPEVSAMLVGATRLSTHIPQQSPELTPRDVITICNYVSAAGASGAVIKAAILLGYYCMLRQSNLTAPPGARFGGPHTLRREEIASSQEGLYVIIRSSKTIVSPSDAVSLHVPRTGDQYCPARAWDLAAAAVHAPQHAPAFTLPDGRPLTSSALIAVIRQALAAAGSPYASRATIHGLRRGSALAVGCLGCPLEHIKAQGTWRGNSVHSYVPRRVLSSVPQCLSAAIGDLTRCHAP